MVLKTAKPTSGGIRHLVKIKNCNIFSKKPVLKTKLIFKKNNCGKNNFGKITVKHKGGGHKKKYRILNFTNQTWTGIVYSIEYDPNRNTTIAAVFNFKLNNFIYILASKNLQIGDILKSGIEAEKKTGHCLVLEKIPVGCYIFNVSLKATGIGKIARAAGNYSIVLDKTKTNAKLLLNSGEIKKLPLNSFATIGVAANELTFLTQLGKAGRNRWLNTRPTVRGVAKNPVDHPNGGGEGKKSGKRKTPWGKIMGSKKK